jgi:nucleoside-diphosphate-sugar epimerase
MQILVTGATGFLGSRLTARLLRDNHSVHAFCHAANPGQSECSVFHGDVRNPDAAKRAAAGCEVVVHLAGKVHAFHEPRGQSALYDAINVEGTRHLLDAAIASGAHTFIFASTVKVFGETTQGCVDESHRPAPQSAYAASKWSAEQLVREYAARYNIRGISLRLPLVYGPTEKGNLFRMIEAIDHRRFPPLPELPHRRTMLHVENFVEAVVRILRCDARLKGCYIVADAQPYRVTEIYEMLCAGLGRPAPRWRVPLSMLQVSAALGSIVQAVTRLPVPFTSATLSKLIEPALYSPNALFEDLCYRPGLSFRDAVPELITFYRRSCT